MDVTVFTTFHEKGYIEYGKAMLQSFMQHGPRDVRLVAYHEDFSPDLKSDAITYRDLHRRCPNLLKFKQKFAKFELANGLVRNKDGGIVYDYRYDAVRFANKIYCVLDILKESPTPYVFWLDADVLIKKDIPERFFSDFLAEDIYTCFLGREHMYSECGFVGYNTKHVNNAYFVNIMQSLYDSGDLFSLKEWHDSFIYDVVRKSMEEASLIRSTNISAHLSGGVMHPFVNSVLGEYMDHLKGPKRKATGSSFKEDYIAGNGS